MRRTFHLRFVPFGTSFKRLRNARRHTLDVPEGAALCDNEIVVDVGGCSFGYSEPGATDSGKSFIFDHHFTRRDNYPSASAAVLHHACDIVELLDSHDEIWIVTHREPDFDALCAVYLVKSLLGGAPDETDQQQLSKIEPGVLRSYGLGCSGWNDVDGGNGKMLRKINWYNPEICPSAPAGWAVLLAAYASCVDSGKRFHADRCRRLHSVVYAGILRRRSHHEDGMEPLFREARRAIVSKELNPIFDALFDDDSRFSPELELLRNEARAYDRDIASAQLKAYERLIAGGRLAVSLFRSRVQLIAQDSETYVLARSRARAQKESVMRLRVVHGLMRDLIRLRRLLRHGRLKDSDKVLLQLGRLKERYRQAWRFVEISFQDFRLSWRWDRDALRLCASRDGAYLLRTNLEGSDPAKLWSQYIQLTEVEAVSLPFSRANWSPNLSIRLHRTSSDCLSFLHHSVEPPRHNCGVQVRWSGRGGPVGKPIARGCERGARSPLV